MDSWLQHLYYLSPVTKYRTVSGTILEIPSSEKSVDSLLTDLNPFGRFHKIVLLLLFCGAAPIVGFQVRKSINSCNMLTNVRKSNMIKVLPVSHPNINYSS